MRGSLCLGLSLALLVRSSLACAADTSPEQLPRTTDEVVQLYATSIAYGASAGLFVHDLAGGDSALSFALSGLGVAALGVGAIAWLDQAGSLSLGQPQAIVTDTWLGASIGAAWLWHDHATHPEEDEWSPALRSGVLLAGATAGAAIGIVRYELSPSAPGQAAFTGSIALWTGVLSSLVAGALTRDESRRDDHASLGAAVGLEVGVIIAGFLGRGLELEPTIGWVRTLDAGALLGGTLVGGAYLLASGGELQDEGVLALASAGVAAGLATAVWLAPELGFSSGVTFSVAPDFAVGGEGVGLSARGAF
jgi:hypothetical protein